MANFMKIFKICPQCKGNKIIIINNNSYDSLPPQEIECPTCEGEGKLFWGKLKFVEEEEG